MKLLRTLCTTTTLALSVVMGSSIAQTTFPSKTVTMTVPYPPGGATDVIARMVAEKLNPIWEESVIINNRPGAGTVVAAESVARAPGDGYTLYMTTAAHTISKSLYAQLNYDPITDFAPISLVSTIPLVLVTGAGMDVKSLDDLIEQGKTAKNGLTLASTGNGTPQHLTGELFKTRTGLDLIHVPYRGDAPMLADLLGGQVEIAFVTLSAALPHIQSGMLNAVALAHPNRVAVISDVPTFEEAGMPDFHAATWFGVFAPATISDTLAQSISADIQKAVATDDLTAALLEMGADVDNSTPEQFQAFIDAEAKKWAEAVDISGAQVN